MPETCRRQLLQTRDDNRHAIAALLQRFETDEHASVIQRGVAAVHADE